MTDLLRPLKANNVLHYSLPTVTLPVRCDGWLPGNEGCTVLNELCHMESLNQIQRMHLLHISKGVEQGTEIQKTNSFRVNCLIMFV